MSPMVAVDERRRDLPDSIEKTYRALRYGLGGMALLLPVVLAGGGKLGGVALQPSLSAYYHTSLRDVFVGVLFAAGAGLLLYKGFRKDEDWALNFAGIFAALVALVPTPPAGRLSLHGTYAVLFFLSLAYVALFTPQQTLKLLKDEKLADRYRVAYRFLGAAMIVLPVVAVVLFSIWPYPEGREKPVIFFVEVGAIYAFGVFWIVKSREIRAIQKQDVHGPASTTPVRPV